MKFFIPKVNFRSVKTFFGNFSTPYSGTKNRETVWSCVILRYRWFLLHYVRKLSVSPLCILKGTVSDLHFVKISVKWLHILTAITDNRVWSVMWVSKSLCSAVNWKYISKILWLDESGSGIPENVFSVYGRAEDACYWQNTRYKWCLSECIVI